MLILIKARYLYHQLKPLITALIHALPACPVCCIFANGSTKYDAVATGSDLDASTDIFEVPIYIPPEFLFPPPPPPSKLYQVKEGRAKDVSAIIAFAASIAGIVVIFALAMFCYLIKDNTRYQHRDDRLFPTSVSTDLSPGN